MAPRVMRQYVDPEELCLSDSESVQLDGTSRYAVTLNIPPYKKINNEKAFQKFSLDSQYDIYMSFILSHIGLIHEGQLKDKGILYTFEKTQKGNLHVHMYFVGWEYESLQLFQKQFHDTFAYPNNPVERSCMIKTCYYVPDWLNYIYKDQY